MSHLAQAPHWAEGMFLTPQHMQAFTRYVDRRAEEVLRASHPYCWGYSRLRIAEEALRNFRFEVEELQAILPDGSLLNIPDDTDLNGRNLRESLLKGSGPIDVLLAIPQWRARSANVAEAGDHSPHRYELEMRDTVDENTGGEARPLAYRRLQARILLGGEDLAGYHTLPLARVELSGDAEPLPTLRQDFAPPLLSLDAQPSLARRARELVQTLENKARHLAEQVRQRRIHWGGEQSAADAEILWRLQVANTALAELQLFTHTSGLRPFDLYRHLIRLVGSLAIFDATRLAPAIAPYDHMQPAPAFDSAIGQVKALLDSIVPTAFERRIFERHDGELRCDLDEPWAQRREGLFVAVEQKDGVAPNGEGLDRTMQLLKLAAPTDVPRIRSERLAGIEKAPSRRIPNGLPDREGMQYWRIEADGAFWQNAREQRCLVLFGAREPRNDLEFSLYVVSEGA